MKRCRKCSTKLIVGTNWTEARQRSSDYLCSECDRAWRRQRYAEGKGVNADYHRDHSREYYAEHREERLEAARIYRESCPEVISERQRAWRNANRERMRELVRRWRENNPERWRDIHDAGDIRRRMQLKELCAHEACKLVERRVVWGRDEGHCRIKLVCDSVFVPFEKMHLDHVVPLSKGGLHCYNNVQTSCPPCNLVKNDKIIPQGTPSTL